MDPPSVWEKARAFLIFWCLAAATYFFIPALLFLKPNLMPYTTLDDAIPLWSWTIVIYLSLYIEVPLIFWLTEYRRILKQLWRGYLMAVLILSLVYLLLPSSHNYPQPFSGPALHIFDDMILWLRSVDVPYNQFPSGHVVYSLIGPIFLLRMKRSWIGFVFLGWGILISLSTLTVKQHNAIDFVASAPIAAILGIVFGWLAHKSSKRLGPKPL